MSNPHNLQVGQELFMVAEGYHGGNRTVKIAKIGRVWATLEGWGRERIDMETLLVDGGEYSSPGSCYLSEADYEQEKRKNELWGKIQDTVRATRAATLTIESMEQIAEVLERKTL